MSMRKKKTQIRRAVRPGIYMAEALLLAAVVAVAILTPQILFRVKDQIMFKNTELGRMENTDMELIGGSYEKSMHLRMLRFAKGLAAGERFYAASKNLELTQELTNYLYSDKGLYQESMFALMNLELVQAYFWENGCTVNQWKQYVVYSDNYGEGICFLLWYIELQCAEDSMLAKLLVDGETGALYGIKVEGNHTVTAQESDMGGYRNVLYEELFYNDDMCRELLSYLMTCYEAQSWEELYKYISEERIYYDGTVDNRKLEELIGNGAYERADDMLSIMLPYEDAFLEFRIGIGGVNVNLEYDAKWGYESVIMYPNLTAGIRQLYQMIPEFTRTG